jgi:peptide/nickel transport system substrate-binding protein
MRTTWSFVFGAAALLTAAPAFAQKSQDTLRIAINNPFAVLSSYDLPVDEAGIFSREVYDYLLMYDEHKQKFVPALAKSWKRIDDQTTEMELRDDITFHNGDKFEASDVKTTIDYIIDPKSKITYGSRFHWIKDVEVISPTKIRIHGKQPMATDLMIYAYRIQIYDGKLMSKMADKQDYGRIHPIGTGPYKVVHLDTNKGILVEKAASYKVLPEYKKPTVKRVAGIPMPDKQTQTAQLMVGGVELLRAVPPDTAKALTESNPNVKATYIPSPNLVYMALDSVGNGPNKALSDQRVRKAIMMGVDRESIIKHIVPGGHVAEHVQNDCFKATIACSYTVYPPGYDPAGAKKLLAEAGYPNGLDVSYVVFAPYKAIGEAVAGDLRKIGVRMNIQAVDISLYRRLQGDGKLEAWTSLFPTGSYPDSGNVLNVLFGPPAMKYYKDDVILDAMDKGEKEFDPEKRKAIYQKAYNRINEMNYHLPISSVPTVYVHSKDVKIKTNSLSAGENYIIDYVWN